MVLLLAERVGCLRDAIVVVGVFEGLGNRFALLVERHPAQFRIFGQAVVIGIGRRAFHRFESPLVVEAGNLLDNHVGQY